MKKSNSKEFFRLVKSYLYQAPMPDVDPYQEYVREHYNGFEALKREFHHVHMDRKSEDEVVYYCKGLKSATN